MYLLSSVRLKCKKVPLHIPLIEKSVIYIFPLAPGHAAQSSLKNDRFIEDFVKSSRMMSPEMASNGASEGRLSSD
jgi:hypothetical protein